MSRWYRSLEIPIQEAALLIKQASFEDITEKIKERQRNLEEEVKKKTILLNKMTEITMNFEQTGDNLNKCTLKELPGIYRLRQTDKNNLVKDDVLADKVEEWMKLLPYVFFSVLINQDVLSADTTLEYNWGLALFETDFRELNLKTDEAVEYIGPKRYISSVITTSGDYIMKDSLQFMFEYLSANQYTVNGDTFGKIIATENVSSKKHYFLEVNIPIL